MKRMYVRGPYWSAREAADHCGWSLAYVYKQAGKHRWRKVTQDGQVCYLITDVIAARRNQPEARPGSNPFDTLSA